MSKVYTSPKFQQRMTDKAREALESAGGQVVDFASDDLSDLDLDEPQYGETIIGELNPEETFLFRTVYTLSDRLEELNCSIGGSILTSMGASLQGRKKAAEMEEGLKDTLESNASLAQEFFMVERQLNTFQNQLYLSICDRLGYWDHRVGVRTKGRIVRGERKW